MLLLWLDGTPVRRHLRPHGRGSEEAGAETLPFDEESFDSAVATFVLCTVHNPRRAADELRRVLRAGASLLYLEHLRSEDERTARRQDRLERP